MENATIIACALASHHVDVAMEEIARVSFLVY
jgi:hypothetical protein